MGPRHDTSGRVRLRNRTVNPLACAYVGSNPTPSTRGLSPKINWLNWNWRFGGRRYRSLCAGFCAEFGVETRHCRVQMAGDHVGVSHCHGDRLMTEDRLKRGDVTGRFEEGRSEGVAQ